MQAYDDEAIARLRSVLADLKSGKARIERMDSGVALRGTGRRRLEEFMNAAVDALPEAIDNVQRLRDLVSGDASSYVTEMDKLIGRQQELEHSIKALEAKAKLLARQLEEALASRDRLRDGIQTALQQRSIRPLRDLEE